ncbi:MAG: NAD(P)-binding protein, partial [Pseudomonadota bacterium]|nr:NAD(P)-binding protein [Pseudomonadota bacterium]
MADVVIVGAGPAGIKAAATLVGAGLRPVLIDESPQPGGQGYRAPSAGLALDMPALMGSEARKYRRIHV